MRIDISICQSFFRSLRNSTSCLLKIGLPLYAGGIEEAGPSQPAATQAEEEAQGSQPAQEEMPQAQGSEPAQEEMTQAAAPLAADSNQSKVRGSRGRGRGRSRGRGRGGASSSRPATDRKSHAFAVHGNVYPASSA